MPRKRVLFLLDYPNILGVLRAKVLRGTPPLEGYNPNWQVMHDWLCGRLDQDQFLEACIFMNLHGKPDPQTRERVRKMVEIGYSVLVKPKLGDSDIDEALIGHLRLRCAQGDLAAVIVASHDAKDLTSPLKEAIKAVPGLQVTVLTFEEYSYNFLTNPAFAWLDLEDVAAGGSRLFELTLPRMRLSGLPPEGQWFHPAGKCLVGTSQRRDGGAPELEEVLPPSARPRRPLSNERPLVLVEDEPEQSLAWQADPDSRKMTPRQRRRAAHKARRQAGEQERRSQREGAGEPADSKPLRSLGRSA